jgi:predicted RND superfamily exporter protein
LTAAVGVLSFAFYDPSIRQICRILAIGCLIATILVIFVLPAILACLDRFVVKRKA